MHSGPGSPTILWKQRGDPAGPCQAPGSDSPPRHRSQPPASRESPRRGSWARSLHVCSEVLYSGVRREQNYPSLGIWHRVKTSLSTAGRWTSACHPSNTSPTAPREKKAGRPDGGVCREPGARAPQPHGVQTLGRPGSGVRGPASARGAGSVLSRPHSHVRTSPPCHLTGGEKSEFLGSSQTSGPASGGWAWKMWGPDGRGARTPALGPLCGAAQDPRRCSAGQSPGDPPALSWQHRGTGVQQGAGDPREDTASHPQLLFSIQAPDGTEDLRPPGRARARAADVAPNAHALCPRHRFGLLC